jgi:hypothetical protein
MKLISIKDKHKKEIEDHSRMSEEIRELEGYSKYDLIGANGNKLPSTPENDYKLRFIQIAEEQVLDINLNNILERAAILMKDYTL